LRAGASRSSARLEPLWTELLDPAEKLTGADAEAVRESLDGGQRGIAVDLLVVGAQLSALRELLEREAGGNAPAPDFLAEPHPAERRCRLGSREPTIVWSHNYRLR